jgi:CTP:molybdopterin cytidylyltransferase MocA
MSTARTQAGQPALVILAAGESRRLGECKALVAITPLNPLELLAAAGASFDEVPPLVVTGADHAKIVARLPPGIEFVFNASWKNSRSAGVGAAALLRPDRDLCLAPVDVPLVPKQVFDELLAAWHARGSPARGWLAPCCAAREDAEGISHGHPVIVGRELVRDLRGMAPEASLRDLRGRAAPVFSVRVESRAILDDLDTPADLSQLRARRPV